MVGAAVCRRGGRDERSVMVVMSTAAVVGKDEKVSVVSVVIHSVAAAATGGGSRGRARRGVSHATEKERAGEREVRGG